MGTARNFLNIALKTTDRDACIIWPFDAVVNKECISQDSGRYPRIKHMGRSTLVNRLVCEEEHGPPPTPKHEAAHSCDRSLCINRFHLSWQTKQANNADQRGKHPKPKGEASPSAKLDKADIIAIRGMIADGARQRVIAEHFGVSQTCISGIHRGETWGHV